MTFVLFKSNSFRSQMSVEEKRGLLTPICRNRIQRINEIHSAIQVGADAFLAAECMCAATCASGLYLC